MINQSPAGLHNIEENHNGNTIKIQLPSHYYTKEKLEEALSAQTNDKNEVLTEENDSYLLEITAENGSAESKARELFAGLNSIPLYNTENRKSFPGSGSPDISCIIVLTANDLFTIKQLIPSIIENSKGHKIEIIIVHNGIWAEKDKLAGYKVIDTPFGWVSKAINAGVKNAKGKYIAVFHDDCMICDKSWIEKCKAKLTGDCIAVTPEVNNNIDYVVYKNVPLFMERKAFLEIGGYDENIFIGSEDIEFTYRIKSAGKVIDIVKLSHRHFGGMSTIIMYSKGHSTFRKLFSLNAIPEREIAKMTKRYVKEFTSNKWAEITYMRDITYIVDKYRNYFSHILALGLLKKEKIFREYLESQKGNPLLEGNEEFAGIYKEFFLNKL